MSGAANKILHRFNRVKAIFRFGEKHKNLYDLVLKQVVGGPSLVFSRYEKVNKSFIGEDENNLVKSIVGYDANALYLHANCENIPTGPYTVYKPNSVNRLQPHRHPLQVAEREFVYFSPKEHYINSPSCMVTSRFSYSHTKMGKFGAVKAFPMPAVYHVA